MNKKVAVLIGAGAGVGLGWLLRPFLLHLFGGGGGGGGNRDTDILLADNSKGNPCIKKQPDDVEIKQNKHLTWEVKNNSSSDVVISMRNWRDAQNQPVTPATDPDPDPNDHERPPQRGLSREVPSGHKRKIRGKSRAPRGNEEEERVYYDVFVGEEKGTDPIVKLVL